MTTKLAFAAFAVLALATSLADLIQKDTRPTNPVEVQVLDALQ